VSLLHVRTAHVGGVSLCYVCGEMLAWKLPIKGCDEAVVRMACHGCGRQTLKLDESSIVIEYEIQDDAGEVVGHHVKPVDIANERDES
jgi:hypothetical protein